MGVRLYPLLKPGVTTKDFLGCEDEHFDVFGWGKEYDLIDMLTQIASDEDRGQVTRAQHPITVLNVAVALLLTQEQIEMLDGFYYG